MNKPLCSKCKLFSQCLGQPTTFADTAEFTMCPHCNSLGFLGRNIQHRIPLTQVCGQLAVAVAKTLKSNTGPVCGDMLCQQKEVDRQRKEIEMQMMLRDTACMGYDETRAYPETLQQVREEYTLSVAEKRLIEILDTQDAPEPDFSEPDK